MIDLGLRGKAVLVTGAGAGIGRAIAARFVAAGATVAVNDIDKARAEDAAAALGALAAPADVRDEDEITRMLAHVLDGLGGLDVAVNNVGMTAGERPRPASELDAAHVRAIVDQNLVATALCAAAEAKEMMFSKTRGVILNVTSGETTRPALGLAAYGAAKAAINHLTTTMAAEFGPHGIRVNAIAPGTTLTETVRGVFMDEHVAALTESIPLRRMCQPDDLANLAVLLASDLASMVTGQFILADGGAFLSRTRPPLES